MSERFCTCKKWKDSIENLRDCILNSSNHYVPYTGEFFEYCPWCGKKLQQKEQETIKVKAIFNRNGANPFTKVATVFQLDRDGYYKIVEVPYDTDMNWLEQCAKEACKDGYHVSSIFKTGDEE